ncbi:energy transducer TonB [Sphingomonas sp. DG1-23]|uniref:energy transducer TonB n=1 Tax=Sphingomonas sp. DG1-23 TaxID=3068316 RepID=UPI00273DB287|nr:energy transducer TonB [Sphingomonas sp. DG1-23]MDP5278227.1 energy transducer TonB [Sphingomonas sp. DG1-23]
MITLLLVALQAAPLAPEPPRLVDPQPVITYDDYPMEAIRRGEAGIVSVLLAVSPEGSVTGCKVTESSLSKLLDSQTCALLSRRAHFEPATDASGRSIAGEYRMSTPWGLEKEHQPRSTIDATLQVAALPNGYVRPAKVQLVYYAAGAPKECAVLASSGSGAADRTACDYATRTFRAEAPKSGSSSAAAAVRYFNASFMVDKVASR